MKTKQQEELINSFLSMLGEENRSVYEDIIMYLSELGYNPKRDGSQISFKHDLHNKQIAKIGFKRNKECPPFFALRFSACKEYSNRFDDVVGVAVAKKSYREAQCIYNRCNYCAGKAFSHVYTYILPDGEKKYHCGASALEISGITADDIEELKKLLKEEHIYLMKYQAGIII